MAPGQAADLIWEVESPFRFFKSANSYALHAKAFADVRGNPGGAQPADIVWRLERRLNDPDCKDRTTPTSCAATAGARYEPSRLGWAAQTISAVCYESAGNPRRYPAQCERKYSWGSAKEDYVLPEAHTVSIGLSPERLAAAGADDCLWNWRPRAGAGRTESRKQSCKSKLTIARVPYSLDRAVSGVAVSVKLPDGSELSEPEVVVEDLFIVALGDSFASGESNPDRPITFSASREMLYDPSQLREEVASRQKKGAPTYSIASGQDADPRVLPRRLLEDEEKDIIYKLTSREFQAPSTGVPPAGSAPTVTARNTAIRSVSAWS